MKRKRDQLNYEYVREHKWNKPKRYNILIDIMVNGYDNSCLAQQVQFHWLIGWHLDNHLWWWHHHHHIGIRIIVIWRFINIVGVVDIRRMTRRFITGWVGTVIDSGQDVSYIKKIRAAWLEKKSLKNLSFYNMHDWWFCLLVLLAHLQNAKTILEILKKFWIKKMVYRICFNPVIISYWIVNSATW